MFKVLGSGDGVEWFCGFRVVVLVYGVVLDIVVYLSLDLIWGLDWGGCFFCFLCFLIKLGSMDGVMCCYGDGSMDMYKYEDLFF